MFSLVARTRALRSITTRHFSYSTAQGNNDLEPNSGKRRNPRSSLLNNAPGWREDLATASEASVKADHETATIDEMQQKTVDYAKSQFDPEGEQAHANYAREQVNGPLGNAGVGEFEGVVGNDDLGPDASDAQIESNGRIVSRRHSVGRKEGGPGVGQANV